MNSYITNLTTNDNTFTWYAIDNTDPNVTGETTTPTVSTTITETISNTSTSAQDIIYKVTPRSANGCIGEEFEIKVSIGVEPHSDDQTFYACSSYVDIDGNTSTLNLNLNDYISNLNTDDYTFVWYAEDNPNISGEEGTNITSPSTSITITDALINTSGTLQDVIYHVTPTSAAPNSCAGDTFLVTVTVGFKPEGSAPTIVDTTCHDVALSLDLANYTTLTDNTYTWYAIANDNVTGESTSERSTSTIDDLLINTSGQTQIVEYIIIPTSAVVSATGTGGCTGEAFILPVEVSPRPEFELLPQYFICPDIGSIAIGEETNSDNYNYFWYEANDMNTIIGYEKMEVVNVSHLAASGGNYVLKVVDKDTGCEFSKFTSVTMAEQMSITDIHISDFNRPNNSITIDVEGGTGTFEYTLHYMNINKSITQDEPLFENLLAGSYRVEVTDTTNCSVSVMSRDLYILDYPRFFTPNGDVDNDTWQITGANFIPESTIYVFDRFGKVLAKIDPTDVRGWDGTFNGKPVIASDYWFKASYIDPNTNEPKNITGHFSIVRK